MRDGLHGTKTLKETVMKKILALIVLSIAMVSCYEDYLLDYPITGIYFSLQQDVRSFIVGEGMKFEVGVSLGGVRQNTIDRNVSFILDPTLITAARLTSMQFSSWGYIKDATTPVTALMQLPANYYQMTPSTTTMVIKSGWHGGTVVIKADSVNFLNDSLKTGVSTYVLPFYITASADADTILESKRFNVVGARFENMLFGNYWHGGAAVVNRPSKSDTTIVYKMTKPSTTNLTWTLTTAGPTTLTCNGFFNKTVTAGKKQLNLTLKGTKIYLSAGKDASFVFSQDGACTFNRSKLLQDRKIILKYKFTETVSPFYTYHCTDTLYFQNRIRDGINEWQDEDPSHYTK
jgi:hypothetical protein